MSHGITKCRSCAKIVAQCRCMDGTTVMYIPECEACSRSRTNENTVTYDALADALASIPSSTSFDGGGGDSGGGGASDDW